MQRLVLLVCAATLIGWPLHSMSASPKKRILVVTTTMGYRHSSIETAEKVIASLGATSGAYEVEFATVPPSNPPDSPAYREQVRATLELKLKPAALKQYQGIIFASTTGELPLPDGPALVQWVREGGAFIGIHSASDTLHGFRPYIEMLGGEFDYHREQVTIEAINEDASHPANRQLPAQWNLDGQLEEIYVLKNFQPDAVHELVALDRHPNTRAPGHFPISWCRDFGQGRVFYTALGHNEHVWQMPAFQQHVLGGIEWALRLR
ncbi:ThuA domain-containing protein [Ideonella sp. YS5]|uniref:ThuA domain-containing protein n=1 Tax=Ideonella sp. YS5 TaxID=3453714 RepID=UPI003EEED04D